MMQREQQTKKQKKRTKTDWLTIVEELERQGEYTHRAILFDPRDAKRGRPINK